MSPATPMTEQEHSTRWELLAIFRGRLRSIMQYEYSECQPRNGLIFLEKVRKKHNVIVYYGYTNR
jgi:hypothetical protein